MRYAVLRARADLHPDLPAMRCVGYRQAWTLLDNLDTLKTIRKKCNKPNMIFASKASRQRASWPSAS